MDRETLDAQATSPQPDAFIQSVSPAGYRVGISEAVTSNGHVAPASVGSGRPALFQPGSFHGDRASLATTSSGGCLGKGNSARPATTARQLRGRSRVAQVPYHRAPDGSSHHARHHLRMQRCRSRLPPPGSRRAASWFARCTGQHVASGEVLQLSDALWKEPRRAS